MVVLNGIQAEQLVHLLKSQDVDADTVAVALETIGTDLQVRIVWDGDSKTWFIGSKGELTREDARL